MNERWLKISVQCDPQLVDSVVDFMVGVMDAGVEVGVENRPLTRMINGFCLDYDRTQDQNGKMKMLENHLKLLAEIFDVAVPTSTVEIVDDLDWANNWKKHFHPFALVPSLIIAPTWENVELEAGEQLIVMDPGMAFGTGQHPTTALSAQFIQQCVLGQEDLTVLDVGTGTGVLGMAAALFGAERVLGIDNDPEAVKVAQKNIGINELGEKMRVSDVPLSHINQSFSLVVANIIHDVLFEMADDLYRLTIDSGNLILSGILKGDQTISMIDCFTKRGLTLVASDEKEEWAGLLFAKNR